MPIEHTLTYKMDKLYSLLICNLCCRIPESKKPKIRARRVESDSYMSHVIPVPISPAFYYFTHLWLSLHPWNEVKMDPNSLDYLRINNAININLCNSAWLNSKYSNHFRWYCFCFRCCFYYNHFPLPWTHTYTPKFF